MGLWSHSADYYVSNKTYVNSVGVRVGLSTRVAKHHRFEVMAKMPVLFLQNTASYQFTNNGVKTIDDVFKLTYKYIQGLVSYKYVF